jgi:hypothetical protein
VDHGAETRIQRRRERERMRRRRLAFVVALVAVCIAVLVLIWRPGGTGNARQHEQDAQARGGASEAKSPGSTTPGAADAVHEAPATGAATYLSSNGVVSKAIVAENLREGTTSWKITGAPTTGVIEGFADRNYVADGDSFGLYVSTTAPSFDVVAYRMGYYQGTGGREVWASGQIAGYGQPTCPIDRATNMASCDSWSRSATIPVTTQWPAGDYVLKLTDSDNQQAYVPITVWDPASHATYMLVNRTLTEEGWNTRGGYDFYQGSGDCILDDHTYPPCNRARVVSLDRPYAEGDGAEDFFGNEYPLIYWMEEQGLDVTYATDITLTENPAFASQHRAWLSLDHDESWTYGELQAAKEAMGRGVNLLFFSGAAIVRHVRLEASPLGPDRHEVDYRNAGEDPESRGGNENEVTSNTWDTADSSLTGQEYAGYLLPGKPQAPMVIHDASSWIFAGTGLTDGSEIPDVIGSDIDHLDPASGLVPDNLQVLAHSPISLSDAYTTQGEWSGSTYSDFTYYTDPASGAGVIDTGDTTFIGDLQACTTSPGDCQPTLLRIVANMLHTFGQGPAGLLAPPDPNWKSVRPRGS